MFLIFHLLQFDFFHRFFVFLLIFVFIIVVIYLEFHDTHIFIIRHLWDFLFILLIESLTWSDMHFFNRGNTGCHWTFLRYLTLRIYSWWIDWRRISGISSIIILIWVVILLRRIRRIPLSVVFNLIFVFWSGIIGFFCFSLDDKHQYVWEEKDDAYIYDNRGARTIVMVIIFCANSSLILLILEFLLITIITNFIWKNINDTPCN